ncbi:MAG: chromosome segregation protein SMC [Aquificaceae bacterium]|nr:chromosome segregation protein SMC [Aquificaceae bacterium]MDW8237615.1 chromosome segregation protein SMC [Aquificaceae bacterium]
MRAWIKKIVVEGFKSYGKQRLEIPLGPGFLAIVGPNGAGKSNIGDALSFALGIASARALRAKNLSYLIYSKGAEKANHALVEVHFYNEGLFELGQEVIISRKIDQEGRSTFRVNGAGARERDVLELLSKAGIYENGYNVVLQGDVVRFIRMSPAERRRLIEEIAGIGEYDQKRSKALEDLGEVEVKLSQLKMLQEEFKTQLNRLSGELNTLNTYKAILERKSTLEYALLSRKLNHLKQKIHSTMQAIESKTEEANKIQEDLSILKTETSQLESELTQIDEKLLPFGENFGRLSEALKSLESKEQELQNRIASLEEQIESLSSQALSTNNLINEEKDKLRQKQEELSKAKAEFENLKSNLMAELQAITQKEGYFSHTLTELEKIEADQQELQARLTSERSKLESFKKNHQELNNKLTSVSLEIENLRNKEKEYKLAFGEYSKSISKLEKSSSHSTLNDMKNQKQKIFNEIKTLEKEQTNLIEEISSLKLKLKSASEDIHVFEGIDGVFGRFRDLITLKDIIYAKAVEVSAGARMSYIVVEDEEVARLCINRLRESSLGRMSFIPLNRIKDTKIPSTLPRLRGAVDFVVNLVEFEKRFERVARFVFGDTILVESFSDAKLASAGSYRLVTLEGELFEKSGVISGGFVSERSELSKAFYNQELKRLEEELKLIQDSIETKKHQLNELSNQIISKEASEMFANQELRRLKEASEKAFNTIKETQKKIESALSYIENLKHAISQTEENINTAESLINSIEIEISGLLTRKMTLLQEIQSSGLDFLRQRREEIARVLEEQKNAIQNLEKQVLQESSKISNLELKHDGLLSYINELSNELKAIKIDLENTKILKARKQQEADSIGLSVFMLKKQRGETEKELNQKRSSCGILELKLQQLKEDESNLKLELQQLKQEEAIVLSSLESFKNPVEDSFTNLSQAQIEKEIKRLSLELEKLGNINFKAQDDYNEIKLRLDELQSKLEKLNSERKSILSLIEEIDTKKLKTFTKTFNAINRNFKKIFAELSPGGQAFLSLEREDDPFAGGVQMMLKPRGKQVQFLDAISGGEKTLGALSLIFAIQEYRPSCFYYFDEVDAHLDEANAKAVAKLISQRSQSAQFIVVTLREVLASFATRVIGVSAREGVSRVFPVENPATANFA